MATLNENLAEESATSMKFSSVNGLGPFPSATSFTWECSGKADVKVGPNTVEMERVENLWIKTQLENTLISACSCGPLIPLFPMIGGKSLKKN